VSVSGRRVAIVASPAAAAVHGLEGALAWGEARTFAPEDGAGLADWAPGTVIALETPPPPGPWRTIAWDAPGDRRVGTGADVWRRAPLPAADALVALRSRAGTGVLVVGGDPPARESALEALEALRALGVDARAATRLSREDLEAAAVVAVLGEPGEPLPSYAPAVLAAGRLLVAPRANPTFGLVPWSDHLPYDHLNDLVWSAETARTFPEAFEAIAAMGVVAAEAHLASAVYGRLAVDAELQDRAASVPA
jgi:hypothetical protein